MNRGTSRVLLQMPIEPSVVPWFATAQLRQLSSRGSYADLRGAPERVLPRGSRTRIHGKDAFKNASREVARSNRGRAHRIDALAPAPPCCVAMDLPEWVARPEGFEHTPPTIVIEGLNELVEALLAA